MEEIEDRHGEGNASNSLGVPCVRRAGSMRSPPPARMPPPSLGVALREVRQFDEAITAYQDATTMYRRPATGTAKATRE
jgi:hypothetical protein